jgi:hypothetical protein
MGKFLSFPEAASHEIAIAVESSMALELADSCRFEAYEKMFTGQTCFSREES